MFIFLQINKKKLSPYNEIKLLMYDVTIARTIILKIVSHYFRFKQSTKFENRLI